MYTTTQAFDYMKVYADYQDQTGLAWFDDFAVRKLTPTAAAVSQYNYVENASFELDGDQDRWPDGWDRYTTGDASFTWEDARGAYTGRRAVSIQSPSAGSSINTFRTVPYAQGPAGGERRGRRRPLSGPGILGRTAGQHGLDRPAGHGEK